MSNMEYYHSAPRRGASGSDRGGGSARSETTENSSTLSEFVRRRFTKEVPVFGGNFRTGMSELGASVAGSVQQAELLSAMKGLTDALKGATIGHPAEPKSVKESSPIFMVDHHPENFSGEFKKASMLDLDKIKLLVEASMVAPEDVQQYFLLLSSAQKAVKKKQDAMMLANDKKKSRAFGLGRVSDAEIMAAAIPVRVMTQELLKMFADDTFKYTDFVRAITHESKFTGRETNQKLAMLGDAVLRGAVVRECYDAEVTAGEITNLIADTQSNDAMRAAGVERAGLHEYIIASAGMERNTKKVVATAVEALYGAAYINRGCDGMAAVDAVFGLCSYGEYYRDDERKTREGALPRNLGGMCDLGPLDYYSAGVKKVVVEEENRRTDSSGNGSDPAGPLGEGDVFVAQG